jgi:hypothetical protein
MVFLAGAIGTGVVGFLENTKYINANDAVTKTENKINDVKEEIKNKCNENADRYGGSVSDCIYYAEKYAADTPKEGEDLDGKDGRPLYMLNGYLAHNQKVRDSYNQSRIIFFGAAGLSAAISVILFAW